MVNTQQAFVPGKPSPDHPSAGRHIVVGSSISLLGVVGTSVLALQGVLILLLVVRRASASVKVTAALFFVLLVAQIGLGYSARSTHGTVAVHIPLGVALFGLAGLQIDRIYQATRRLSPIR